MPVPSPSSDRVPCLITRFVSPLEKPPRLVAHLDFKGVQYHPAILLEKLSLFADWGYDALLVEYEDIFPYRSVSLAQNPAEIWEPEFLSNFLGEAKRLELEVIPLQQCLGHLEYVLRWDCFKNLRLSGGFPSTLDITSEEARSWLKTLLCDMIERHEGSRFIHLGMDEARALGDHARLAGVDPLELFLEYLEELCLLCRQYGKTPLIWSDMLEDHISPVNLERIRALRDHVVLVSWDYHASQAPLAAVRFAGWRCSRSWLDNPEESGAPRLKDNQQWMEDWPSEIEALVEKYRVSPRHLQSLFQAGIWRDLGFRVLGACGAATSDDGQVLPFYHRRMANIDRWRECINEWQLDGMIVTAWARAGTCSPPDTLLDLHWPMYEYAGTNFDKSVGGFFGEVPRERLRKLLHQIGRCRESWWIEGLLVKQLNEEGAGRQLHHAYEWQTLILMLRTQESLRSIEGAIWKAERYFCGIRLPEAEWRNRKDELEQCHQALGTLAGEVDNHLGHHYLKPSLEEWMEEVYERAARRITQAMALIDGKLEQAQQFFAQVPRK